MAKLFCLAPLGCKYRYDIHLVAQNPWLKIVILKLIGRFFELQNLESEGYIPLVFDDKNLLEL